jgi:hypothetical protein
MLLLHSHNIKGEMRDYTKINHNDNISRNSKPNNNNNNLR